MTLAISLDAAEVWVGGNQVGTTPMELELNNRASHTVAFKREGIFRHVKINYYGSCGSGSYKKDGSITNIVDRVQALHRRRELQP